MNRYPGVDQELSEENSALRMKIRELEGSKADLERAVEALKVSQSDLRTTVDNVNEAVFIHTIMGEVVDVNNKTLDMYRVTREEAVSMNILDDFSAPDNPLGALDEIWKSVLSGAERTFDWKARRPHDNSSFSVEVFLKKIARNNGDAILATVHDITERKRAEEELLESRALLKTLLDAVPIPVFYKDRDGRYRGFNRAFEKFFGRTGAQLIDKTASDINPPGLAEIHRSRDAELLENGGVREYESQIRNGLGKLRSVIYRKAVLTDSEGVVSGLIGTILDITDRKRMEEEVVREKLKLKSLSDNAPFGMILIDREGRFTYMNPKFTELFGFDRSDIPDGRAWFRKAYPDAGYRHTVISTWIEDSGGGRPGPRKPRVFTVTRQDGTEKIIHFITCVLASGDCLVACEDITDLRRLESQLRQAQKMEAIGTLAGGIAHDFNNILTAILGYSSLLQMNMDRTSPLKLYVDPILSATQKAVDLTQSLLAFSRQQPITLNPLDINMTIQGTKKLLQRLLTEDIELNTSFGGDHMVVMADKTQIDQILLNLVTNARDAMPQGGVLSIETDLVQMDSEFIERRGFGEAGRYVLIKVSDTGMGMDDATRENIFDPFFTTKEVGKGTGLGLATVYGIVKQHRGYIAVDSKPGQGTIFRIYLPAARATFYPAEQETVTVKGGEETILIAEDNATVRYFTRDLLQQYGYRTIEAVDGEDAIFKFRENQDADLIIVDSVMPKKNGREVYEEIRRISPQIKALFTSGYTKDIVLDKGIGDKEFDFIAKPLSPLTLLQKVREVLDR